VWTVRTKLFALVAACLIPAAASAILRAREGRQDLLDEIEARVNHANDAFVAELDEDRDQALLGARLVANDARIERALMSGDHADEVAAANLLGGYFKESIAAIVDARGHVVATSNPRRAPRSFATDALSPLLHGSETVGLYPMMLGTADTWTLVVAVPIVTAGGTTAGAIALVTPLDAAYLEHVEKKVGSDLALKVNEVLVAACADHPAPMLEAHGGGVTTREKDGKNFALSTFEPAALQRPGQNVEVTASEDVTGAIAESMRDMWRSLGLLGGVAILVLAIAVFFARRMSRAVTTIANAAGRVHDGIYTRAVGVDSGDELEDLAHSFNEMVSGLEERDRVMVERDQLKDEQAHLKATFGKYVTQQVLDAILKGKPELGKGEMVPVTVLFSDIRSFTSISEHMEPKVLLDFLNIYFTGMVESVMSNHGVVDKFIGDAIMAVFGAPIPGPDDPYNAVLAAIAMRANLRRLNEGFKAKGLPELRAGIGIHTGMVVAGNMGHENRMEYTVIGDAVNLASRLESATKDLKVDILLSEDTYKLIKDRIDAEPMQRVSVKGREQDVLVYRLVGLTGEMAAVRHG
jgi:adenylate cyclase